MDLLFSKEVGSITICLKPKEVSDAWHLIRLLVADEKKRGNEVPVFDEKLFKESGSKEKISVVFTLKHSGFAIRFIEQVIMINGDAGGETAPIEQFLFQVEGWHKSHHCLH